MISTQVNFFYFAGSIVGGVVFVGNTIAAIALAASLLGGSAEPPGALAFLASGVWGSIYLACLSMVAGVALSELSIRRYYYRFAMGSHLAEFKDALSDVTGLKAVELDQEKKRTPRSQIKSFAAFAHNKGHPNDLYDIAGRGRLAGTAAINCAWVVLLASILLVVALGSHAAKIKTSVNIGQTVVVALVVIILAWRAYRLLLGLVENTWVSYSCRSDIFACYKYLDGELTLDKKTIAHLNEMLEPAQASSYREDA